MERNCGESFVMMETPPVIGGLSWKQEEQRPV